jgi:hypothetical protein
MSEKKLILNIESILLQTIPKDRNFGFHREPKGTCRASAEGLASFWSVGIVSQD